jgi:hypothetical protein
MSYVARTTVQHKDGTWTITTWRKGQPLPEVIRLHDHRVTDPFYEDYLEVE